MQRQTVRVKWRFAFLVATALVLLWTAQLALAPAQRQPQTIGRLLATQTITWYAWLALLPLILRVARRFRRDGRLRRDDIPFQLLASAGVAVTHAATSGLLRWLFFLSPSRELATVVVNSVAISFASSLIRYWMIAAVCHALLYYHELRARAAVEARLSASLAEAKLESLRGRLQPHFLFNTLNGITALVRDDPLAAEEMISNLADLLRASLAMKDADEIPLADEIVLLEKYASIERARFHSRLSVDIDVPAALATARVPQLLLQPIVENAIRHGIAPREGPGHVRVVARARDGRLRIEVVDDGVGVGDAGTAVEGGIGLRTTRERLMQLHGADQRLEVAALAPTGTRVTIELPLRLARDGGE